MSWLPFRQLQTFWSIFLMQYFSDEITVPGISLFLNFTLTIPSNSVTAATDLAELSVAAADAPRGGRAGGGPPAAQDAAGRPAQGEAGAQAPTANQG